MTKYICECLDGARKCTHETSGFSAPTVCCVRANATCHWRRVKNQEVETPVPKLPEWCKIGAWVWNDEIGYGKIEQEPRTGELLVFFGGGTRAFEAERYKEARLRPWNDDELKSKVGKVFEDDVKNLTLCFRYHRDDETLHFAGKLMSAQLFTESDWKLDGSPCGVLEHKNEDGEWVE